MGYTRRKGKRAQKIIEKDPYIQQTIWEYAIKLTPFYENCGRANFFEFLFRVLRPADVKKVTDHAINSIKIERERAGFEPVTESRDIINILSYAYTREDRFTSALEELEISHEAVYSEVLDFVVSIFEKYAEKKISNSDFLERIQYLKKTFILTDQEIEILIFLYIIKVDVDANGVFCYDLHMDEIRRSVTMYYRFFDMNSQDIKNIFSKKSTLIKTGLLTVSIRDDIQISELVTSYLSGISDLDLLDSFVKKANLDESLELENHNISSNKIGDITSLLNSDHGLNILLYGSPGTGKSEFAKSLGKRIGKDIYFINQSDEQKDENLVFRRCAIVAAMNMLDPQTAIIVVDECDNIINSCSQSILGFTLSVMKDDTKAWLTDLLETTNHKIIWIANKVRGVDPAVKRRFSYSLEFLDLGLNQRINVWKTQKEAYKADFIDDSTLEVLAKKYKINAGGIALALKDVQGMSYLKTSEEKITILENIINQHQRFIFGEVKINPLQESYSLEAINSDVELDKVLNSTRKFLEFSEKNGFKDISNMNFLLHGPSGTGKTEFAKFLANSLGRELLIKRMSDIQSMWVGETEKNIANVFKQAETSKSILFLDEADSLFINRESAYRSWEVGQTNELLCQMENFKGILICATNLKTNMDVAVMRRFNFKIRFDYLTDEGKLLLASRVLGLQLDEEGKRKLLRIPTLTPGDFKVVRQKNFFNDEVTPDELLSQLENEASYRRVTKPVGLN